MNDTMQEAGLGVPVKQLPVADEDIDQPMQSGDALLLFGLMVGPWAAGALVLWAVFAL